MARVLGKIDDDRAVRVLGVDPEVMRRCFEGERQEGGLEPELDELLDVVAKEHGCRDRISMNTALKRAIDLDFIVSLYLFSNDLPLFLHKHPLVLFVHAHHYLYEPLQFYCICSPRCIPT